MTPPNNQPPADEAHAADNAAEAPEAAPAANQAADTPAAEAVAPVAESTAESPATDDSTPPEQPDPLQQALADAAAHKDNALRLAAELENTRRRAQKQVEDAHKFAITQFALAMSEVQDLLQKALDAPADTPDSKLREGVSLTHRKLAQALQAHHVHPIQPDIGAAFDPNLHQAIGQLPATAQTPPDTVAAVVSGGVMLHGRMIRPAHVMVAAASEADDTAPQDTQPAPTGK